MFQFSRGQQVLLVLLLAAILSGAVVLLYTQNRRAPDEPLFVEPTAAQPAGQLTVHVAGAVKSPGLYSIPVGSRVRDAIQKAGGATSDAFLDELNLAAFIQDGEKITVPSRAPEPVAEAPYASGAPRPPGPGHRAVSAAKAPTGRISLNKASAEELEQLPGIGPVYARRIVEFRQRLRSQNGQGFTSVEQLLEVPGIGNKRFEQIKPLVTL